MIIELLIRYEILDMSKETLCLKAHISNLRSKQKENPEEDESHQCDSNNPTERRDCKKLRGPVYEIRLTKSEIENPKSEIKKSRSSVWLEHYTDNVGVSSSNLLGTTLRRSRSRQWAVSSGQLAEMLITAN